MQDATILQLLPSADSQQAVTHRPQWLGDSECQRAKWRDVAMLTGEEWGFDCIRQEWTKTFLP